MKQLLAALVAFAALSTAAQPVTPPPIAAKSFVLVDYLSGQTLAAASENDRFEPASLTKLMTAWITFDAIRAGQIEVNKAVAVSDNTVKAPGARMFLASG